MAVSRAASMKDALEILLKFTTREDRNDLLANHRQDLLPENEIQRYEELRSNELLHINHVRRSYQILYPERPPSQHDRTKDEFYFFITIVGFTYKLKDEMPEELWRGELNRHFREEPHHPEYESLNPDKRLSAENIDEMSVDRLSRNLQFNNGNYNDDQLASYEPKFVHDHESRIQKYRDCIKKNKDAVQQAWRDMKPSV